MIVIMILEMRNANLFSGKLGTIPGPPVNLKIKRDARPFCARTYTIPQAFATMARKEVDELENISVLMRNINSSWGFPCFFCAKKDQGIRFITDLCKLILFPCRTSKMSFLRYKASPSQPALTSTVATITFCSTKKVKTSAQLFYHWVNIPLMVSSDIFQARMTHLFQDFPGCLIVYIDNILLFMKGTFHEHLEKLEQVFQILKANNLHVHVEETFLASQQVNYLLGYTLTTTGIKPQIQKHLPILCLALPSTRKQLRAFLGFIKHYKVLWHKKSELAYPLTHLTSINSPFKWTAAHQQSFLALKNLIARQVLLRYLDFSKPFKLYTDASNYQLGASIVQTIDNIDYLFQGQV